MTDQYTMQDPTTQYTGPKRKMADEQGGPGLEQDMPLKPDAGEATYRGSDRLKGRKALVTGADSGIDVLANIAGKQQFVEDIADLTTEQFDETYKTNVYSMFWLCKAALAHMPAGSTIINTASLEGYQPEPILLDYASTKWAINGFSKALAQQVVGKGIRVNVVAPGPVWTPLQVAGGQPRSALKEFGSQSPMGRPGQPAEMAPAYVFLASPESSYVNATTINANGGLPTP